MKLADTLYTCALCKQRIKGIVRFARHLEIRHPTEARRARKDTKHVQQA